MEEAAGKTLLQHLLDALNEVPSLDGIVVATTDRPEDDVIATACPRVFRGSSEDVLERYVLAAREAEADVVVRVTADCPLLDPHLVEQVIQSLGTHDYVRTEGFPRGLDVEAMTRDALERAHAQATEPGEREHVTLYLYRHPERFDLGLFRYRLTVDTAKDFEVVRRLLDAREGRSFAEVVRLLAHHPSWARLNQCVQQKEI